MTNRRKTPLAALLALLLGASSLVAAAPSEPGPPEHANNNEQAAPPAFEAEGNEVVSGSNGNRPDDAGPPALVEGEQPEEGEGSDPQPDPEADSEADPEADPEVDPLAHFGSWEDSVRIVEGNDSAASCPPDTTFVKHDAGDSGLVAIPAIDGIVGASIAVTVQPDGSYWGFTIQQSDAGALRVVTAISKGGNDHAVFDLGSEDVSSASDLVSPLNGGGNVAGLSHASFCVAAVVEEEPVSEEPEVQEPPAEEPPAEEPPQELADEELPEEEQVEREEPQEELAEEQQVEREESEEELTVEQQPEGQPQPDSDDDGQDEPGDTTIIVEPQPTDVLGVVAEPAASIASACLAQTDHLSVVIDLDNSGSTTAVTYTVVVGDHATDVEVSAGSDAQLDEILLDQASGALAVSVLAGDEALASSTFDAAECTAEVRGIVEVRDDIATEEGDAVEVETEVLGVSEGSTDATLAQTGFSAVLLAILGLLGMISGGGLLAGRRQD